MSESSAKSRGAQRQFLENMCSEDDLRSTVFGTSVGKFLPCLSASPMIFEHLKNGIQSTLSNTDTFGTGTKCPSSRGVRLIESQIKGVKKGRDQL